MGVVILVLILLSAFFSAIETAFSFVNKVRVQRYKDDGKERSAIAAYNAGFVVSDWLNDTNYSSDGKNLDSIPYPETKNYVDKVESAKEMYIKLYYSQSN